MESVTLVGMRPRAVGNPIENLCSVVSSGGEENMDSNRLPSLAVATGVASSGKPPVPASSATNVQQLYDQDKDTVYHQLANHESFDHTSIMNQNPTMIKPLPARLPAIQNGGVSKTDLSGVALKRSATTVTIPMSPDTAMKLYMHKLSAFEHHEIFDYQKVCFMLDICYVGYRITSENLQKIAGFVSGKDCGIGTLHYNWPMSAHASQAFSTYTSEHDCTDSEHLPVSAS